MTPDIRIPGPTAPELSYRPATVHGDFPIGIIGCGEISSRHLASYRKAGYRVTALCDHDTESAETQRKLYFPEARVYADYRDLLDRKDIAVADIITPPEPRPAIIRDALLADKHVLSQKPFVLDLAVGTRLADLAESRGLHLAVNQNGRWAPHISYLNQSIRNGIIGRVSYLGFSVSWDHSWIEGTPYEEVQDLILYDFAIHWFDFLNLFMEGKPARNVTASTSRAPDQAAKPPFIAAVTVEYEDAVAHMAFDGSARHDSWDRTMVMGSSGTLISEGPDLNHQEVVMCIGGRECRPELSGRWFNDGFHGAMAELLSSIEQNRQPSHHARNNLDSLALCFAAIASARADAPMVPGRIQSLPG